MQGVPWAVMFRVPTAIRLDYEEEIRPGSDNAQNPQRKPESPEGLGLKARA